MADTLAKFTKIGSVAGTLDEYERFYSQLIEVATDNGLFKINGRDPLAEKFDTYDTSRSFADWFTKDYNRELGTLFFNSKYLLRLNLILAIDYFRKYRVIYKTGPHVSRMISNYNIKY